MIESTFSKRGVRLIKVVSTQGVYQIMRWCYKFVMIDYEMVATVAAYLSDKILTLSKHSSVLS